MCMFFPEEPNAPGWIVGKVKLTEAARCFRDRPGPSIHVDLTFTYTNYLLDHFMKTGLPAGSGLVQHCELKLDPYQKTKMVLEWSEEQNQIKRLIKSPNSQDLNPF